MRFPRPCLKCNNLHQDKGDYCQSCRKEIEARREADPVRRAKKKALYNSDYRRRAAHLREIATHCHLCEEAFTDRTQITADHLFPGNPLSPLVPAHKSCNSSRGNRPIQ